MIFSQNAFAAEYEVRDLGGWDPVDINNNGQIVGSIGSKAAIWEDGVLEIISELNSSAVAINDSGQVAGMLDSMSATSKGFFWENGTLTILGIPFAQPFLYVYSIDNNGRIYCGDGYSIGSWLSGSFFTIWTSGYRSWSTVAANNLGDVFGYWTIPWFTGVYLLAENNVRINPHWINNSQEYLRVNDNKQVIGGNYVCQGDSQIILESFYTLANNNLNVVVGICNGNAAIYENAIIRDLNDLIPQNLGWILTSAKAINDKGQIVCSGTLNGTSKACLLTPVTMYGLSDPGTEFPVNYENYGTFSNQGTTTYSYDLINPAGLTAAVGEGIYPNTASVLLDPRYQEYLSSGKLDGDIWSFVNSNDPWADYFKWATATGVQEGEKLFYTALALENAGQFKHAVKAYNALIVHFPFTQAYNPFENIYWYPGIAAIDAIARLTRDNPEIGYEQINAKITIKNGYNSDPVDDIFTASAGEFAEYTVQDRIDRSAERIDATDLDVRGNGRVQVIKRSDNSWQLRVDAKPFQVKGVTYSPTQVGMTADDQTAWQWLDTNGNQLIDAAEEAWVDANRNNLQDADEPTIGDFQLLKDMGCNTIRIFHYAGADKKTYQPTEYNKPLLRQLYQQYGIMVMMGDFFGGYTIGSGASWENGTDYTNPEQRAAMKEVVRQMVLDHKDEPYVLMWLLGNENNMASEYNSINATRTNAADEPQAYAEFLNEVALMIHEIDPDHPVAVGNLNLGLVEYYAQYAPELDIIATNHYTDRNGVGVSYLREAREKIDRPLIIAEYGADAYHQGQGINELEQNTHHLGGWKAITYNGSTTPGEGNVLGGIIFEWTDEWWKAQSEYDSPWIQEIAPQFYWGIMPDHFAHEEWLGICSQGNGTQSPFLRQPRSVYDLYKQLWTASLGFEKFMYFYNKDSYDIFNSFAISWDGYPGLSYTVESSNDNLNWQVLVDDVIASPYGGRTRWIVIKDGFMSVPQLDSRTYYRVGINNAVQPTYVLETFIGNQIPLADDLSIQMEKNTNKAFSLNASDAEDDPLTYNIITQPEHGSLSGTGPNFIYTPDLDYCGLDKFSYQVSDGIDVSAIANINIEIFNDGATGLAEFIKYDTTTQGNWIGQYGADGYNVIGDTVNYPDYAQVSRGVSWQWVWNSSTTNVSALEKVSGSDRIAGCWYGSPSYGYDILVNITDGQTHQVAIYCLDWESSSRRQTLEVIDAVTGAVLDTQALNTAFTNGVYLVWNIRGSVIIRVAQTWLDNAVISGIFFGNSAAGNAPSITAQPQAATVISGQTAAFNVTASGSDTLIYQWYKNDVLIDGATTASYTTGATLIADNGAVFKVNISNDYGTITSNTAVLTVNPANNASVVFLNKDITTQGNWIGQYGADGYNVIGDTVNYPYYAQVSPSRSAQWVWNSSTTNVSALRKSVGSERIAACWYGAPSQDIRVDIKDGQTHQVAIYCLDWESSVRRQTVEVLDAVSGAVLDTQELNAAFTNGVYLVWNIRGSVIIRVKQTWLDNAVISGIFFGNSAAGIAPSITAQPQAATVIAGQPATFNVTVSGSDILSYKWYKNDVLINGATTANYTTGATLLADNGAVFKVNISNDYGTITSNAAVLTVNPANNASVMFLNKDITTQGNWIGQYGADGYNVIGDTVSYPNYAQVSRSGSGQWVWNSSTTNVSALRKSVGSERIAACWYGAPSQDIRVDIKDGQTHQVAIYCLDWESSVRRQTVEVLDAVSGAVLDTQELNAAFTNGVYLVWNIRGSVIIRVKQTGLDNVVVSGLFFDGGGGVIGNAPSITAHPLNSTVIVGQPATFNVTASGSDTLSYKWYKNDVLINGATTTSYITGATLLADNGAVFKVNISNDYGTITSNAAVLTVNPANNASVMFLNKDITTQGNWIGTYGSDGYNVIGDTVSYPNYAQVSRSGSGQWVWNSATTNISALQKAVGSERIAACWYGSPSQDIRVNITDGQTHQVAIYCLDWESSVRRQTVEVLDAVSGAVLDTQQLNIAFTNGVYLTWSIRGSVIIRVKQTGLDNVVISGIFFDDQSQILDLVRKEADHILSCQYLNPGQPGHGSINDVPGAPSWIVPREMGLAILGLIRASDLLQDPLYLERAEMAADYLVRIQDIASNNFEARYPGSRAYDGSWFNQYGYETAGDINNTSYPYITEKLSKSPTQTAEVMIGFYALGYANADLARKESMRLAAENLISLQGTDGLIKGGMELYETYAGSQVYQYRISDWRWSSDNSFAYQALRAAESWAVAQSDNTNAARFHNAAQALLNGINNKLYVSNPSDPDYGVWWGVIDGNDIPQFPSGHEWMSYAPQMLDVPAQGVGQQIVGDWIHNTLQITADGNDFGAVVWNDAWASERKSPGFSFQAMLAWLDLQQADYAQAAKSWVMNSGLWYPSGGWIDWIESDTVQADDWQRFIDTSFYAISACTGGYDFNIPESYIGN